MIMLWIATSAAGFVVINADVLRLLLLLTAITVEVISFVLSEFACSSAWCCCCCCRSHDAVALILMLEAPSPHAAVPLPVSWPRAAVGTTVVAVSKPAAAVFALFVCSSTCGMTGPVLLRPRALAAS
jgi:hypothetical protein